MGEMRKDVKRYESEEASECIKPSSKNEYVPLPKSGQRECVQPSENVSLGDGPNDTQFA